MELSPRPVEAPSRRRNPLIYGVLLVVLVGLGFVVWKGLSSASLYFYNADEAVEKRVELGDDRFRLQGTVLGNTLETTADGVEFAVVYNGVRVEAHHEGDPPDLFEAGIPVVLEGRWDPSGDFFASDRILVKHSEEYEAENEDRLDDADEGGDEPSDDTSPTTADTSLTTAP